MTNVPGYVKGMDLGRYPSLCFQDVMDLFVLPHIVALTRIYGKQSTSRYYVLSSSDNPIIQQDQTFIPMVISSRVGFGIEVEQNQQVEKH